MAGYNVPRGKIAVHDKALAANVADTVTFADEVERVEILSDGTAAIYVCVTGDAATVGGADCQKIPQAGKSIVVELAGVKVSLISAATPVYSVTRADAIGART